MFRIKNCTNIYLSDVKISWEDAAKAVERGDADVVPTFLANHQIDEEGTDRYGNQGYYYINIFITYVLKNPIIFIYKSKNPHFIILA